MIRETKEAINLICTDCSKEFFFSAKEQKFYADQGFQQPKRCFDCRKKKREKNESKGRIQSDAEMMGNELQEAAY